MTCIKAQSMITPFINDKLSIKELEDFLKHVNSCSVCKEELEVYYALLTAMKQLEEDKSLSDNFGLELSVKLERSHDKVFHAKYTYYRKKVLLVFTMILLAFLIGLSYANRSAIEEDITPKSDFHIRKVFRNPGNDLIELQLREYLIKQGLEEISKD